MIYFITDGTAIKVGRAHDVASRLKDLNCGNSRQLTLIASVEGHSKEEACVHAELAEFRLSREWFQDCSGTRSAIQRYLDSGIVLRPARERRPYQHRKRALDMPTEAHWPQAKIDIDRLAMAEARSHFLKACCATMESVLAEMKKTAAVGGDFAPLKARAEQIMNQSGVS